MHIEQDGRLAPAYFSPNYKCFDHFLQTVTNKTTVLILVFKEFLQINSTTDFCTLSKRVSRFSLEKISSHSAEKFLRGTLLCFRKFLLSKNVRDKRGGGIKIFCRKIFVSHCRKFPKGNSSVFHPVTTIRTFCFTNYITQFSLKKPEPPQVIGKSGLLHAFSGKFETQFELPEKQSGKLLELPRVGKRKKLLEGGPRAKLQNYEAFWLNRSSKRVLCYFLYKTII